jgi:hypothetical protein
MAGDLLKGITLISERGALPDSGNKGGNAIKEKMTEPSDKALL